MKAFSFAKVPPIYFGAGQLQQLSRLVAQFPLRDMCMSDCVRHEGQRVLLITGRKSFE